MSTLIVRLTDDMIQKLVTSLKQSYAHEQDFFKSSQQKLRTEFDHIQNRLSKIIDIHLDVSIDQESYRSKVEEYKKRQREITSEMQSHVQADESCLVTIRLVLALAKDAREIFESSNVDEKRELLNFVFDLFCSEKALLSNLKLDGENLHLELKEP